MSPGDLFITTSFVGTEVEIKDIQGVCLDIDETLSTQGKLTTDAYAALWQLKDVGFLVVPVTGRPAGWCDHIARFWPVSAVVGENGAFTFFMQNGVRSRIDTPAGSSTAEQKEKLGTLRTELLSQFKDICFASDQDYREFDLAVDICEDVKPWSESEIKRLLLFCESRGVHAKRSSIHINIWVGDYDKGSGFDHWLSSGAPGAGAVPAVNQWLYIGDSPNDEPMFKKFKNSVGVANLKKYLDQLKSLPRWMTDQSSGAGFVEMAKHLISQRRG